MDRWLRDYDYPNDQSRWTPIQWVEFREEVKRRVESGEIVVVHGRKSDKRSVLHVWKEWKMYGA